MATAPAGSPATPPGAEQARQLELLQEALSRQHNVFHSVLESISDGVAVANADGQIIHFNAAAVRLLGLGASATPVDDWSNRYGCYLPDTVTPYPSRDLPLARAIRGETVQEGEVFIRHAGRPRGLWVSVNAGPLRDAEGRVVGGVAAFRDITARKRQDDALKTMADELARSNQDLQQFAFMVSHDLQQPLRKVSRFCQLLQHHCRGQLDRQAEDFLRYAIDATEGMAKLIQDLLTYGRVGRGRIQRQTVDLGGVFRKAQAELGAEPETIMIDKLPAVRGDATQLGQLASNLLGNALKYQAGRPLIRVSAERQDGEWRVAVRDNGIGIEPGALERIFAVFERAAPAYPGTGLGLAICKRIVENHGGRIWAESQPGQGTTVFFTLPGE